MCPTTPTQTVTSDFPRQTQSGGPSAHEDLTIAEHLDGMSQSEGHRPDEKCFLDNDGKTHWIANIVLRRFITEYGARHPSDFLAATGTDWQKVLFNTP